jgi:hypothetical protein
LQTFIDKSNKELIPFGKSDTAFLIANELLKLEKVREDKTLYTQVIGILGKQADRINDLKGLMTAHDEKKGNWANKYPNSAKKYGVGNIIAKQFSVCNRGQLFYLGQGD